MNTATAAAETLAAAVFTTISIPPINAYWPSQGGKFRGIVRGEAGQRDYLLIEHVDELPEANWKTSIANAAAVEADGHKDFSLPSRAKAALLYANAKDEHETDDIDSVNLDTNRINLNEEGLPDGPHASFREHVKTMIAEGAPIPCFFAALDY